MYSLQKAMAIDKSSPECRNYLLALMAHLEEVKKAYRAANNPDNEVSEGILNEVVGAAQVEDYATNLFNYADQEDRAARFHKNTIKSFYTAYLLFEVMEVFGSTEDNDHVTIRRRYAKWKAWNINKCLKAGEQPIPGPVAGAEDEFGALTLEGAEPRQSGQVGFEGVEGGATGGFPSNQPSMSNSGYPNNQPANSGYPPQHSVPPQGPRGLNLPQPPSGIHAPPSTPMETADPGAPSGPMNPPEATSWTPPPNTGGVQLTPKQSQQAQKYCKFAISALQYEDTKTAIKNLQDALQLLMTGNDPNS